MFLLLHQIIHWGLGNLSGIILSLLAAMKSGAVRNSVKHDMEQTRRFQSSGSYLDVLIFKHLENAGCLLAVCFRFDWSLFSDFVIPYS